VSKRPSAVFIAVTTIAGAWLASGGVADAEGSRPRAVVELFTSQGCGKCPPADALLTTLSADPGLITLSYAVDYWDYLGWKDTAAKPEFTRRQRAYAEVRGDHAVYTPQMVINGRVHVVGSDRAAVEHAIAEEAQEAHAPSLEVEAETTPDALIVRIADAPATMTTRRATVWLARYETARSIPIRKGENSGRTVTYTHLVTTLQPIGMWKGKAVRIEMPRRDKTQDPGEGCAVLVQADSDDGPGPILGARVLARPGS
jgi:hypothetical protein